MTLTIGKKNDDRLKLEFNLDKQQVENASLTVNNDAGIILKILVLKIFQKQGSLVPMRIMVLILGQTLSDLSGLK